LEDPTLSHNMRSDNVIVRAGKGGVSYRCRKNDLRVAGLFVNLLLGARGKTLNRREGLGWGKGSRKEGRSLGLGDHGGKTNNQKSWRVTGAL